DTGRAAALPCTSMGCIRVAIAFFLVSVISNVVIADDDDTPSSHPTVTAMLEELRAKYGTSAAAFQGHLLNFAIQGGSVLEAKVSIAGIEPRGDLRYLRFNLDSGIVYDDAQARDVQLARIWSDIVEPSARRAAELSFPADGIALWITFYHGTYSDPVDLQRQLGANRIMPIEAAYFVPGRDAAELSTGQITRPEFAARTEVQVDGQPAHVNLDVLAGAADKQ